MAGDAVAWLYGGEERVVVYKGGWDLGGCLQASEMDNQRLCGQM